MRRARELVAAAERRRLRPFSGVGRLDFPYAAAEHEGVVRYAADLDRALLQAGAERVSAKQRLEDLEAELSRGRDQSTLTAVIDARSAYEALNDEIERLQRERLDVEMWLGEMFAFVSRAVHAFEVGRRLISPPKGVEVFGSQAAFVAENSHRRVANDIRPMDAGGMDFGYRWRRFGDDARTAGRWTGNWRLSWIKETSEIYAARLSSSSELWLIASGYHDQAEVWDLLTAIERRQDEPNSLLVVTRHILADVNARSEPPVRRLRRAAGELRQELSRRLLRGDEADAALAVAASVIAREDPGSDAQRVRQLERWVDEFRDGDQ